MPFRVFPNKGGGSDTSINDPFKVLVLQSTSGIGANNIDAKCPCDTSSIDITSSNFFSFTPGQINQSGKLAVKVFSGSMLYTSLNLQRPFIKSYESDQNNIHPEEERKSGVMRIYGLNYPIFLDDFLSENAGPDATLKIWLTVCFPSGQEEEESESAMDAADPRDFTLHDCKERANVPMGAFISFGTQEFPSGAQVKLINKGSELSPRYEKRQIAANIPIAEVDRSGIVVRQYLNSNLTLTDINVQGFPCKMPLSIFSPLG